MKRIILLCVALVLTGTVILLGGCGTSDPSQTVGWAVGADPAAHGTTVVLKTVDGVNWQRISSGFFVPGMLGRDVSSPDNQTAWVVLHVNEDKGGGQLLRTIDGGSTWQEVTPAGHVSDVMAIKALSSEIAWAAGRNGYIARTADGGKNWSTISVQGQTANSMYTGVAALDHTYIWVSGYVPDESGSPARTVLVRTRDGVNWEQLPPIGNERNILGIAVSKPDTVRVTMQETTNLYSSFDGGDTWIGPVNMGQGDLNNVAGYGDNVWTVADYGTFMYSTTDGGWKKSDLKDGYRGMYVVAISAIGNKNLWIGGNEAGSSPGGMLWSGDGGLS